MSPLVALRAMFGQDEANHGTARYCVDRDGLVWVPPEAVSYLTRVGGFALVATEGRRELDAGAVGTVRLHHGDAVACSYGGRQYAGDPNGDVAVPPEAAAALMAHGYVPVSPSGTAAVSPRPAKRTAGTKAEKE